MSDWNGHVEEFVKEMKDILIDRGNDYGDRPTNFQNIADGWKVILGSEVSPRQVALCMTWVKIARESAGVKHDSMIDSANYSLIADYLARWPNDNNREND